MSRSFSLAPMSPLFKGLTIALLGLPVFLGILALVTQQWLLLSVGVAIALLYIAVWLGCRPTRFVLSSSTLDVVFPLWRRSIPRQDILSARLTSLDDVQQEVGWAIRIGVGGLWGGFGWLWTARRGLVEFYISRNDGFVLIERRAKKLLLITPAQPTEFIAAIAEELT